MSSVRAPLSIHPDETATAEEAEAQRAAEVACGLARAGGYAELESSALGHGDLPELDSLGVVFLTELHASDVGAHGWYSFEAPSDGTFVFYSDASEVTVFGGIPISPESAYTIDDCEPSADVPEELAPTFGTAKALERAAEYKLFKGTQVTVRVASAEDAASLIILDRKWPRTAPKPHYFHSIKNQDQQCRLYQVLEAQEGLHRKILEDLGASASHVGSLFAARHAVQTRFCDGTMTREDAASLALTESSRWQSVIDDIGAEHALGGVHAERFMWSAYNLELEAILEACGGRDAVADFISSGVGDAWGMGLCSRSDTGAARAAGGAQGAASGGLACISNGLADHAADCRGTPTSQGEGDTPEGEGDAPAGNQCDCDCECDEPSTPTEGDGAGSGTEGEGDEPERFSEEFETREDAIRAMNHARAEARKYAQLQTMITVLGGSWTSAAGYAAAVAMVNPALALAGGIGTVTAVLIVDQLEDYHSDIAQRIEDQLNGIEYPSEECLGIAMSGGTFTVMTTDSWGSSRPMNSTDLFVDCMCAAMPASATPPSMCPSGSKSATLKCLLAPVYAGAAGDVPGAPGSFVDPCSESFAAGVHFCFDPSGCGVFGAGFIGNIKTRTCSHYFCASGPAAYDPALDACACPGQEAASHRSAALLSLFGDPCLRPDVDCGGYMEPGG